MPDFSFDFSAYTGYVSDKFSSMKLSSVELFDKICDATVGLFNEVHLIWSENFNTVVNNIETTQAPPVVPVETIETVTETFSEDILSVVQ